MNYKNLLLLALGICLGASTVYGQHLSFIKRVIIPRLDYANFNNQDKKTILTTKKNFWGTSSAACFAILAGYGVKAYKGQPLNRKDKFVAFDAMLGGVCGLWLARDCDRSIENIRVAQKAHRVQLAAERKQQQELAVEMRITQAVKDALEQRDQEYKARQDAIALAEAKKQKAAEDAAAPLKHAMAEGRRLIQAVVATKQPAMTDADMAEQQLNVFEAERFFYYGKELTEKLTWFILRENPLTVNPEYQEELTRHLDTANRDPRELVWSGISEPIKIILILYSELMKNVLHASQISQNARLSARIPWGLMERSDIGSLYEKIRWNPAIFSEKLLSVEENTFLQKL